MTARIIAVANQKGGVGKTTTVINLATGLAAAKKNVLVIDLDPQGNATTGLGVDKTALKQSTYTLLIDSALEAEEGIESGHIPRLSIIGSTPDLSAAELELVELDKREFRLAKILEGLSDKYDYIVIDCPPSLGLLTVNALVAAHGALVPLQCEFFALEGLSAFVKTVGMIQEKLNPSLQIQGILLTMYNGAQELTRQVEEDVRTHFGDKVYRTVIPRHVKVAEAPSHGKPSLLYDYRCSASHAYIRFTGEFIHREEGNHDRDNDDGA